MDFALLSGASLLSLSGLLFFKSQLQQLSDQLQTYSLTNILTPSAAFEYAQKNNVGNEVRFKVFLQGLVTSDHPFVSKIAQIPTIFSQYYIDNIYSNERLYLHKNQGIIKPYQKTEFLEKNGAPVFQINDFEEKNSKFCKINRNINVDASNALELIGHREHLRSLNPFDRLIVLLGLIFKFIIRIKLHSKGFRGFKIGVQEIEYGIQLNKILIVFGDLIVDLKNGTMRMDKPLHILKDKSALIQLIKQRMKNRSMFLLLTTMLFSFFLTWLVRRCLQKYREFINKKKEAQLDQLRGINQVLVDGMECIVCCQRPRFEKIKKLRSVILKPCKHLSMCRYCFLKLPKQVCPICKAPIKDNVEIFVS